MPIIDSPPPAGSDLAQGDVLKGIKLFLTKRESPGGGATAGESKAPMCLVLSRRCVIGHKKTLVVLAVDKIPQNPPDDLTFEEAKKFLLNCRDAVNMPDLFYLGHIPDEVGRYVARIDSIHTIEVPQAPADLQQFADAVRVGRLDIDFIRELHVRVFSAFAEMGFDDNRWYSDQDLQWLIAIGESETVKAKSDQAAAEISREMSGKSASPQKQGSKEANILSDAIKRLESHKAEWNRRLPNLPSPEAAS